MISLEPAIVAKILKFANSPYYAGRYPAGTLEDAVVRLGTEEVKRIAITVSIAGLLRGTGRYHMLFVSARRHLAATALLANEIAGCLGRESSHLYVAGLMHDMGSVVAFSLLQKIEEELELSFPLSSIRKIGEKVHIELGARILRLWGFPEEIALAVELHHSVGKAAEDGGDPLLVMCADRAACHLGFGDEFSAIPMAREPLFRFIGMDGAMIEKLGPEFDVVRDTVGGLF